MVKVRNINIVRDNKVLYSLVKFYITSLHTKKIYIKKKLVISQILSPDCENTTYQTCGQTLTFYNFW